MSGSQITAAIAAAGQLFAGYGVVTLGPVQLSGMALPSMLPIGGGQTLTVHKLPGGERVIDVMGQDDDDIDWSGIFDGADASTSARTLDKLRRSGTVIALAWDVYSYQVIVKKFRCETRLVPPMNYSITCQVVQDNTLVSGITPVSMIEQVTADLSTGNPVAALGAVSQGIVGSSVSNASVAAGAPDAGALGSSDYNSLVSSVNNAATQIQSAATEADQTLAPYGVSLGTLSEVAPAALDTLGFGKMIQNAAGSCGDIANLSLASGYVSRAQVNLIGASA